MLSGWGPGFCPCSGMIAGRSYADRMEIKPESLAIRLMLLLGLFLGLDSCGLQGRRAPSLDHGPGVAVTQVTEDAAIGGSQGATGQPTASSSATGAGVKATSKPQCTELQGRFDQVEYSSQLTGEYVPVLVYLPPCYSETDEYPVLFLLHGKPQDEKHWRILGIDEVVHRRIQAGDLQGVILVMPQQPEPLFSQTDGGPGSYEGEFISTLVPFIESRYAVSREPARRALAGISRGGVWALEIGFTHPHFFGSVAALSPALNVNVAREAYDPMYLAQNAETLTGRIFLASGDVDSAAADTEGLHLILTRRGIEHRYTTVPGGHEGATWEQLLGEMLDYLARDW